MMLSCVNVYFYLFNLNHFIIAFKIQISISPFVHKAAILTGSYFSVFFSFIINCFQERETMHFQECKKTKRWFLFFPIVHESCRKDSSINVNERGKIF